MIYHKQTHHIESDLVVSAPRVDDGDALATRQLADRWTHRAKVLRLMLLLLFGAERGGWVCMCLLMMHSLPVALRNRSARLLKVEAAFDQMRVRVNDIFCVCACVCV